MTLNQINLDVLLLSPLLEGADKSMVYMQLKNNTVGLINISGYRQCGMCALIGFHETQRSNYS